MREELNQMERVEAYVLGKLSGEEKAAFENAMEQSAELKDLVAFQQLAVQAAKRKALRAQIESFTPPSGRGGNFTKWALGISTGIIVVGSILLYTLLSTPETPEKTPAPEALVEQETTATLPTDTIINEVNEVAANRSRLISTKRLQALSIIPELPNRRKLPKLLYPNRMSGGTTRDYIAEETRDKHISWVPFDVQSFAVDAGQGGLITCKSGTLLAIPGSAFKNASGDIVEGTVQVDIVEALHWTDMIAYNLETTSGEVDLKSAGMLRVVFSQNGEMVYGRPENPFYVEVPVKELETNMKLWEGQPINDDMDWVQSKKTLKKHLTRIDQELLDFLPENFASLIHEYALRETGKPATKEMIYEMYYNLADTKEFRNRDKDVDLKHRFGLFGNRKWICAIHPLKIKELKSKKYRNTFVSTKEFEARLKVLHQSVNGDRFLELYLENLDRDMYYTDSLIANSSDDIQQQFQLFAEEHITRIGRNNYSAQLQKHYNRELKNQSENGSAKGHSTLSIYPDTLDVVNYPSYGFEWNGSGWIGVLTPLSSEFTNSPHEVTFRTDDLHQNASLYTSNSFLNTLTELPVKEGVGTTVFSDYSGNNQEVATTSYGIGLERKNGALYLGGTHFSPFDVDTLRLDWKMIDENNLKQLLCELHPDAEALKKLNATEMKVLELPLHIPEAVKSKKVSPRKERKQKKRLQKVLLDHINNCNLKDNSSNSSFSVAD